MNGDDDLLDPIWLNDVITRELEFIRNVGTRKNLLMATSNKGAYEAFLMLMLARQDGFPVYQTLEQIQSRYASQSGIIKRLRMLRDAGLIEAKPGRKGSEVRLAPSKDIIAEFARLLDHKYNRSH